MNVDTKIEKELLLQYGAKQISLKKGEIIFAVGEKVLDVYLIERGSAKICYFNEEGREFVYGIATSGQLFNYSSAILDSPATTTVITTEPTQVLKISREKFITLLHEHPMKMFRMLVEVSERLREISTKLGEMAVEDAEYRLGTLMNYYKNRRGLPKDQEYVVPLTRQQLADMTGLRVETVIRTIKSMEQKGLLEIIEGKIFWTPKRSETISEPELTATEA